MVFNTIFGSELVASGQLEAAADGGAYRPLSQNLKVLILANLHLQMALSRSWMKWSCQRVTWMMLTYLQTSRSHLNELHQRKHSRRVRWITRRWRSWSRGGSIERL